MYGQFFARVTSRMNVKPEEASTIFPELATSHEARLHLNLDSWTFAESLDRPESGSLTAFVRTLPLSFGLSSVVRGCPYSESEVEPRVLSVCEGR